MVTVNVWSEMLATPTTAGPVSKARAPAAHRKRHRAVRRPVSVGNPLHDVVVEPFEPAGHRGRRFDVKGTFGRAPVGDGRAERHHHGVRHTHHRAEHRLNRCDGRPFDQFAAVRSTSSGFTTTPAAITSTAKIHPTNPRIGFSIPLKLQRCQFNRRSVLAVVCVRAR